MSTRVAVTGHALQPLDRSAAHHLRDALAAAGLVGLTRREESAFALAVLGEREHRGWQRRIAAHNPNSAARFDRSGHGGRIRSFRTIPALAAYGGVPPERRLHVFPTGRVFESHGSGSWVASARTVYDIALFVGASLEETSTFADVRIVLAA